MSSSNLQKGSFVPQTVRYAGLLAGLMVFSWVWIIHLPRAISGVGDGILPVFEALAVSGMAFAISPESPKRALVLNRVGPLSIVAASRS